jgi:hypothetical protein
MELRRTEDTINELVSIYESIRQSTVWTSDQAALLTPLPTPTFAIKSIVEESAVANDDVGGSNVSSDKETSEAPSAVPCESLPPLVPSKDRPPVSDMSTLVKTLQTMEKALSDSHNNNNNNESLPTKMDKFRKRLAELDPVTEKPRYGPKSQARVERLLFYYDFLCRQILTTAISSPSGVLFRHIQQQYHQEQQALQQHQAAEEQAQLQEERRRQEAQNEQAARERALAEQEVANRAAQEQAKAEALRRQAEQTRQRRLAQEEARRRAEQEYLDSVVKGPDGVRKYINVLRKGTAADPAAQTTAIQSLCTIFEQINRNPENVNFRKIRKNHPGFHRDIGRHDGSTELLIAAGFRPTMLPANDVAGGNNVDNGSADDGGDDDDATPKIACLVSKEPNLEQDMDGWYAWYDLNKATLEILQKEVQNL